VWHPKNSSDTSGTPGYIGIIPLNSSVAPEVLLKQNHGMGVDYFALGIIAHELMLGKKPYPDYSREAYKKAVIAQQIVLKKSDTPESWNHEASDFINKVISV